MEGLGMERVRYGGVRDGGDGGIEGMEGWREL